MVTITDGVRSFRVPAGAVKPYENMGFHIATSEEIEVMNFIAEEHYSDEAVEKSISESVAVADKEGNENKEDELFIEELLEKPLSQWSNDEVKEFVRIKDIDTSGVQKVSQVRAIIKTYIEEQNKNA